MTQPVEQLTQGTGLIATASAAANFGQHRVSMRLPLTVHSGMSTGLLIVSVMSTTKVSQFIEIAKTTMYGERSGMVVKEESLSADETIASTRTLLIILGRGPVTFKGLKRMSDITSIRTAIHLIKVPHAVTLIVVGSTEKKLDLRSAVPGAEFAHLQAGYVDPTASVPTATDLKSSIQSAIPREVKPRAHESRPRATAPFAQAALRIGSGLMRRSKGKIFAMCAED